MYLPPEVVMETCVSKPVGRVNWKIPERICPFVFTPVLASGSDARKALLAGLAAWQSYRTGRPVKLAEISASAE